jgi:hypothetical protein
MRLERKHSYPLTEAVDRVRALVDYWDKRHGVKTTWTGNSAAVAGKVKGVRFSAEFTVGEGEIVAEVEVGFLAEKLGGKSYVNRKLDEYLDPQNTLASLQQRIEA